LEKKTQQEKTKQRAILRFGEIILRFKKSTRRFKKLKQRFILTNRINSGLQ
jgi:hypothetical protein